MLYGFSCDLVRFSIFRASHSMLGQVFGGSWRPLWVALGPSCGLLARLVAFGGALGPSWRALGCFWAAPWPLLAVLRLLLAALDDGLGRSWVLLGCLGEILGSLGGHLGRSWAGLGRVWGGFGEVLEVFGHPFEE